MQCFRDLAENGRKVRGHYMQQFKFTNTFYVFQVACGPRVGLCSSSLQNRFFCLKLEYELYIHEELIHRKSVYSEVRLWDENQRGFSRAVKTTQLSYSSNFSFQNLEAINTSNVLSECNGISPLGSV